MNRSSRSSSVAGDASVILDSSSVGIADKVWNLHKALSNEYLSGPRPLQTWNHRRWDTLETWRSLCG